MLHRLPLELLLQKWEDILHEPRIVRINLNQLHNWDWVNESPNAELVSPTPVPILLQVC
jgi:hypothetical protein